MSELRDRSAVLADFANDWLMKGGSNCPLSDVMSPDVLPRICVMVLKDGDWYFEFTGEMHSHINGVTMSGRVADRLPPHIWARVKTNYARALQTRTAQMIETTGYIGRSVDLLVRQLHVVCTPPEGVDAVLASVYEWDFRLGAAQEEILAEIVGRCAGEALRDQFLADRPSVPRVSAQLALLREIAQEAYGDLSAADRTYLQIFLLSLHSEYDTDGHNLYQIH